MLKSGKDLLSLTFRPKPSIWKDTVSERDLVLLSNTVG